MSIAVYATQIVYISRDIFCAGRVVDEDLRRTMKACGGAIQTSVNGLTDNVLGTCEAFQEEQIGGDRYTITMQDTFVATVHLVDPLPSS